MRAVMCKQYGPPESLEVVEMPSPRLGKGEVLISVRAVSVSQANVLVAAGNHPNKRELPFITGGEAAGIVKAVGEGISAFKPGDAVLGPGKDGGCAEEILASADKLRLLPPGLDLTLAAGAGSYATSLHALRDVAKIKPGETVLVLGAAGGVGLSAVELAKQMGARVVACASSQEKLDLCKRYGADELINYEGEDLRGAIKKAGGDKGFDVVIDPVGGKYADPAVRGMGWGGRYVIIGFAGGFVPDLPLNLPLLKGCAVMGMSLHRLAMHDPAAAKALRADVIRLLADGKIKPHVCATYPLERTADAMNDLRLRKVLGKVIVTAGST